MSIIYNNIGFGALLCIELKSYKKVMLVVFVSQTVPDTQKFSKIIVYSYLFLLSMDQTFQIHLACPNIKRNCQTF